MGLARKNRLTKSNNFSKIKKLGKKFVSEKFVCYICSTKNNVSRLAVVVSSKLGNSCLRHRIKRLMQEVFRLNAKNFIRGIDVIIILNGKISAKIYYSDVEKQFLGLLKKDKVLI
jgi:ribonuclease P protein component